MKRRHKRFASALEGLRSLACFLLFIGAVVSVVALLSAGMFLGGRALYRTAVQAGMLWLFWSVLGVLAIAFQALLVWESRRRGRQPAYRVDEGVTKAQLARVQKVLDRCGKKALEPLAESYLMAPDLKSALNDYESLAFDPDDRPYYRSALCEGSTVCAEMEGFYVIGDDGGELTYLVRKGADDGRFYVFDLECAKTPEPYASDWSHFVARCRADRKSSR